MGMFDTIIVFQRCPYCNRFQSFDCQTKDLDLLMYVFHPLEEDWEDENSLFNKEMRENFPIFKSFPLDKEFMVWGNQAEFIEAKATLSEEFKNLEFVTIIASCQSLWCNAHARLHDKKTLGYISGSGRSFKGKIKVKNGKLIGKIYDIILDNETKYEELKFLDELK
jgi:hypothetical protein